MTSIRYTTPTLMLACLTLGTPFVRGQQPDGASVMSAACTGCHSLRVIANARRSRAGWTATVGDMIQRGAPVFPEEMAVLISYLSETLGPKAANASSTKEDQKQAEKP